MELPYKRGNIVNYERRGGYESGNFELVRGASFPVVCNEEHLQRVEGRSSVACAVQRGTARRGGDSWALHAPGFQWGEPHPGDKFLPSDARDVAPRALRCRFRAPPLTRSLIAIFLSLPYTARARIPRILFVSGADTFLSRANNDDGDGGIRGWVHPPWQSTDT